MSCTKRSNSTNTPVCASPHSIAQKLASCQTFPATSTLLEAFLIERTLLLPFARSGWHYWLSQIEHPLTRLLTANFAVKFLVLKIHTDPCLDISRQKCWCGKFWEKYHEPHLGIKDEWDDKVNKCHSKIFSTGSYHINVAGCINFIAILKYTFISSPR